MAKPDEKPSFWKQEITFRRKPKQEVLPVSPDAPAARSEREQVQPEQTSIWKKEIGFRRKEKEHDLRPPVEPEPAEASQPEPLIELLYPLGDQPLDPVVTPTRPLDEPARAEPAAATQSPEPQEPEPVGEQEPVEQEAAPAEQTSIWKKELSFRRKPKQDVSQASPDAPAARLEREQVIQPEQTSIWKKEISFGRNEKEQGLRAPVEPLEPEPAEPSQPEPLAELLYPLAEESLDPVVLPPLTGRWEESARPEPAGTTQLREPEEQEAVGPEPVEPSETEPLVELLHPLTEEPPDPVELPPVTRRWDEPTPTEPAAVTRPPEPREPEEEAHVLPAPTEPEPVAEQEPEPVAGQDPEPVVAQEPEPVEQEAAPPAKTSIWKKEISLGRKPKEAAEEALDPIMLPPVSPPASSPAQPEAPHKLSRRERKEAKRLAEEERRRAEEAQGTQKSIWKKEVTLRRKPKDDAPSVPAVRNEREEARRLAIRMAEEERRRALQAKAEKTSFWKKEITLGRKPKPSTLPPPEPEPESALEPEALPDLQGPIADDVLDPIALPPVTPSVAGLVLPEPVVEPLPARPVERIEPAAEPQAQTATPLPEPELPSSRRERRQAKQEAERLAKEQRKREKRAVKKEKAAPAHKRLVGLKIGGSQLAAVQVVNKGGPRVIRMARAPLERGIVVGGELREADELAAALKTFFRKNKLPRNSVRLGISNNRIGVRTFEISGIEDGRQLANAIRFRAQEALPIPLDEAVIDYRVLEDRIGEDGVRSRRVLLVVAHRELVERYVTACRKAGLKLVGIDLEAFALLRALGDPARPAGSEDAGLVCISIGHDRSTLAVSNGSVCEFTRVLAWGGSSLDIAVARVLDLTPSQAEPIKRALSLVGEGETAGLEEHQAAQALAAMSNELQAFARELVASLRFYQEQADSLGIAKVLVTGGGAMCAGLAEELERLIGVTVRVADPLARVKVPRKLRKAAAAGGGSLAVAVGLGIED